MDILIDANGIQMNYRLEGPAGAPVVMLSNSFLADVSIWDSQVEAITSSFRLLRYDTRGHGRTEATVGPYSISLLADDAIALLDQLQISNVHFLGHSMGGLVGQSIALNHAARLSSLILCDTACSLPPASAWDDRIALAKEKGPSAFCGPMTERWLTGEYRVNHPYIVERLSAMIAGTKLEGVLGCANALKNADFSGDIDKIDSPTLILVGAEDKGTPVSASKYLCNKIAGSKLTIFQASAHLPFIEEADSFNQALLTFLEYQCKQSH